MFLATAESTTFLIAKANKINKIENIALPKISNAILNLVFFCSVFYPSNRCIFHIFTTCNIVMFFITIPSVVLLDEDVNLIKDVIGC